jgi:hypothetical protein
MKETLRRLHKAVATRSSAKSPSAALDVAEAGLDLELRYRPPAEIDIARLELWTRRLRADVAARDWNAVDGDISTLEWIRDRIAFRGSDESPIDDHLRYLQAASEAHESAALTKAARALAAIASGARPISVFGG